MTSLRTKLTDWQWAEAYLDEMYERLLIERGTPEMVTVQQFEARMREYERAEALRDYDR